MVLIVSRFLRTPTPSQTGSMGFPSEKYRSGASSTVVGLSRLLFRVVKTVSDAISPPRRFERGLCFVSLIIS